jgi:hypothetical protein
MIPTTVFIQEENNLLRGCQIAYWLNKSQIEEILQSCYDTLKYYEKYNYNDDYISKLNQDIFNKEYEIKWKPKRKIKNTNVYIMIDHNTKFYKIGKSINPIQREKTLQSEKPTIELIYSFKAYDYDERVLQDKYKDKRIRGEWFNLDQYDIDYIKNNYK